MSRPGVGIFAAYPNRESVERRACARLPRRIGFDMRDISVIGRGFEATEVPAGVVTANDIAGASAGVGAAAGFLCGFLIGTAVVAAPGLGPVFIAGSLAAALAGGAEAAVVGAVIGGAGGATWSGGEVRVL